MNLDQLNLNNSLRQCGAANLAKLFGFERLESISSIMNKRITESQISEMLIQKHGSQILSNRDIRNKLLDTFSDETLNFLLHGKDWQSAASNADDTSRLKKTPWKRNSSITKNWLELFNLDDNYLPPVTINKPNIETIDVNTPLYPYQKRVKDQLVQHLLSSAHRVLIHMPTGAGKTRTAIEGLVDYWRSNGQSNGFMIWIADSEELCEQAEETFAKLWSARGDRPINLVRLWGSHNIKDVGDLNFPDGIIIASAQKIRSLKESGKNECFEIASFIKQRAKLIVFDEAHKSIAPTYKSVVDFLCDLDNTKLIGLTATPGRSNFDQIEELVAFYGNNKITITDDLGRDIDDPIKYLQDNGYLSSITRRTIPTNISIKLTPKEISSIGSFLDVPPKFLIELSKNDQRNAIIVKEIAELCEKNHQVIVFACSVEHAHLLSDILMLRGISSRCVDGNTHPHDRSKYIDDYRKSNVKVIINYGVLTTGFDAPNTTAVVIARPVFSLVLFSQMVGRGVRGVKMGGTENCDLIYIEDDLSWFLSEGQTFKFFDNYWE